MARPNLPPAEALQFEIKKAIRHARIFEVMDFRLAHIFLWTSLIASFSAAILILQKDPWEEWKIAIVAGIPGLVVAIDKSFEFGKRALWGEMYRIELEQLRDELMFQKSEPYTVATKLRQVKKDFAASYAQIGFFSPKADTR